MEKNKMKIIICIFCWVLIFVSLLIYTHEEIHANNINIDSLNQYSEIKCRLLLQRNSAIQNQDIKFLVENFPEMVKSEIVSVSAYNNVESQTDATPNICAWGDKIRPGIVAVSRDLLKGKYNFNRNKKIYFPELDRHYTVLDKMNKRYSKTMDIFMGKNIQKARKFGRKKMKIYWIP
jgi:3D (Asp-Asp-Asp) domain-containing protein